MTSRRHDRDSGSAGSIVGWRYRILLVLAAAAVFWERLWPRLWPAACILGAFVGIALLDVLPRLPDWLHACVLASFALAFLGALFWARPAFRPVSRANARSRLERDSALEGRPLQALEDPLAAGRDDLMAEALWRRHQQRAAAIIRHLKLRLPHADMARYEPWGIRAGVLLLLVVGVVAGYRDGGARLLRAVDPGLSTGGQSAVIDLWITPPAYTAMAPIYLGTAIPGAAAPSAPTVLQVPRGSALLARATGLSRPPMLVAGPTQAAFAALGEGDTKAAWRAETTIDAGERIAVRAGRRELAAWPMQVIADNPPSVAFADPPASVGNGLLGLAYRAQDDYGVTGMAAVIVAADPGVSAGEPLRVPLPPATLGAKDISGRTTQDLAAHPLAGQPVKIHLEAQDGAGQTANGEAVEIVLPERTFSHPLAQRLVRVRKSLWAPTPENRSAAIVELSDISDRPEAFAGDTVVALAVAVAKARLRLDAGVNAIPSVRDLLWETALRIEQGDVPLAERQLDEAKQRLTKALQEGAPQAEIERLMDDLQRALDRYLSAAAAELARHGGLAAPLDPQSNLLQAENLSELLDTAREFARNGGRDGAIQMLAELQHLLDSIRSGLRAGSGGKEMLAAQEMLRNLRALSKRQQELLEKSFQRLREQRDAADGSPGERRGRMSGQREQERTSAASSRAAGKKAAAEQQELRSDLADLTQRLQAFLGTKPAPLASADQAMRGAAESLGDGRLGDAVSDQSRAVDALEQALQASGQAMAQRMGNAIAFGIGQGNGDGMGDIFGRGPDGRRGFATGNAKIPDRGVLQRAQEIRDELRRRAAERSRPRQELDYIDRLLRQF